LGLLSPILRPVSKGSTVGTLLVYHPLIVPASLLMSDLKIDEGLGLVVGVEEEREHERAVQDTYRDHNQGVRHLL